MLRCGVRQIVSRIGAGRSVYLTSIPYLNVTFNNLSATSEHSVDQRETTVRRKIAPRLHTTD